MNRSAQWELDDGVVYHWAIGSLALWICRTVGEWSYAWTHTDQLVLPLTDTPSPHALPPEDLVWTRVVSASPATGVAFAVRPPDRATVIKGEQAIAVLPHTTAELFAPVPVWITASTIGDKPQILFEVPTQRLHRRWFGSPMQGTLCYSVHAGFSTHASEVSADPVYALCPIRVRNLSNEPFRTDALYIQSDQLNLYRPEGSHWLHNLVTNSEITTVAAADDVSFSVSSDRGKGRPDGQLVARARRRHEESWWKRGYVLFQRISNYG